MKKHLRFALSGGLPYNKDRGGGGGGWVSGSSESMKTIPKRYPDTVLWTWLELFFSPEKYEFLHNTLPHVILCQLNILEGTRRKSSCCTLYEAKQHKKYQNHFF